MTSHNGYVYAYRKAWNHPAFNNLREAAIWNYLYQNAFYEDGECNFNGHTFQLKRGQIAVSISYLAKGFGMTDKGIRVVIQKLEKLGMLGKQGASKGSIITICNYEKYQQNKKTEGEQQGIQGANRGQAEGNNNNKIINKENNIEAAEAPPKNTKPNLILPDFVPLDLWDAYMEVRKRKKAANTDHAKKLLLGKLAKFHEQGYDLRPIMELSIERSYLSFFEQKERMNNESTGHRYGNQPTKYERTQAILQQHLARIEAEHPDDNGGQARESSDGNAGNTAIQQPKALW